MNLRRFASCAAAAAIAISLLGCSSAVRPVVSPSPTPTSAPVIPTPTASVASSILVGGDALTVLDSTGDTLAAFHYATDTDVAIAYLDSLFGRGVQTPFAGGGDQPPSTLHDWDGFRLVDRVTTGSDPHWPDFFVRITSARVRGIAIEAVGGATVGWPLSKVEMMFPDDVTHLEPPDGAIGSSFVRVDHVPVPPIPDSATGDLNFAVSLAADEGSSTITSMIAPSGNFGA